MRELSESNVAEPGDIRRLADLENSSRIAVGNSGQAAIFASYVRGYIEHVPTLKLGWVRRVPRSEFSPEFFNPDMRCLISASLLPLLLGCTGMGSCPAIDRGVSSSLSPSIGVVFVANGSGDVQTASTNLSRVVAETSTPLQVVTVDWSHGYRRFLADHLDHANHLAQGRVLADQVTEYRRTHPDRRISLLGYSTGCAVVLAAAEILPKDSVDQIILLAPAVCASYDLRPALATARNGIDVFYSNDDRIILGLGMKIVGTAEGCRRKAAGQCGFTPIIAGPGDAALYEKLHQHKWDPVVEWSGHDGGHYGSIQPDFTRVYVLPLLVKS
jgi:hypothetical protein